MAKYMIVVRCYGINKY